MAWIEDCWNDPMTTQQLKTSSGTRPLRDLSNTLETTHYGDDIGNAQKGALKKRGGLRAQGNAPNRLVVDTADVGALMKKAMQSAAGVDKEVLHVYEDTESSGEKDMGQNKKRHSGGQSRKKPARYGDWFDGDDAELEKMVDEFNDESVVLKDDAQDVARHVREITDGLCSQLDMLIDEKELDVDGKVNEQSLREKLLESWEGKSYYDRLLQMAGSTETTSTLIQKSLETQGKVGGVRPDDSSGSPVPLLSPPKRKTAHGNTGPSKPQGLGVLKIPDRPLIPEEALSAVADQPVKTKASVAAAKRNVGPGLLKVSARGSKPMSAPWDNQTDKYSSQISSLKKDVAQQQDALVTAGKRAHDGLSRLCVLKKEATLHEALELEKQFKAMEVDIQKIISLSRQLANQITVGKANASVLVKSLKKKAAQ